jgi:hypothetical protein
VKIMAKQPGKSCGKKCQEGKASRFFQVLESVEEISSEKCPKVCLQYAIMVL